MSIYVAETLSSSWGPAPILHMPFLFLLFYLFLQG